MKHFFIINPAAGQGRAVDLEEEIRIQSELRGLLMTSEDRHVNDPDDYDVVIYRTKGVGDAERYVRYICRTKLGTDPDWTINGFVQRTGDEKFRFYSCGGDGTLNEVVNGCQGYDGAEVACIPFGTGDDYIKNYPDAGNFSSVSAQMDGEAVNSDLIRYTSEGKDPRYCINMFNIGLDCNTADLTQRMKKLPFVSGPMAYILSLMFIFIRKRGTDLTIVCDDETVYDDKLLLVAIANGQYCGGGVRGIPQADVNDGLLDVSIVKKAGRLEFLNLFKEYKKGEHLADEHARRLFIIKKSERVEVTPRKSPMKLCIDGEISEVGKTEFEIVPDGIRFSVPAAK